MWRSWVKKYGIRQLAEALGISYESVRRWALGITRPEGKNLHNLVHLAFRSLSPDDFMEFLESLGEDILGIKVRPHAVNE